MSASETALTVRRITGGARLIGLGWMLTLVLVALARDGMTRPVIGWWLAGVTALWFFATAFVPLRISTSAVSDPLWMTIGDSALAAFALVSPELAGSDDLFYGGFPGIAVAIGAAGRRSRGWMVAGVLSVVTLARFQIADLGDVLARLSALVTYGMLATIVGWAIHVLYRTDAARRQAEEGRARAEERATVAAHLHDSVLQTLALIQREAEDPSRVVTLARRQEVDLREWLYGTGGMADKTGLARQLASVANEVEEAYGIRVELVTSGDAGLTKNGQALLGAAREAIVNAAKHAGVDQVDVFLEVDESLKLFVRDRGTGFDRGQVGTDRAGIRDSIEGRLRQHGGTVTWSTAAGTEVRMEVPR